MQIEITRREIILRIFRADTLPKCLYDGFNKYNIIPSYSRPYYGDLNKLYYDKENNEYLRLSDMAFLYGTLKIDDMILSDEEKEYLSNIIKPFKSKVKYIVKMEYLNSNFIEIYYNENDGAEYNIALPNLEDDTMYKNMKTDKKYTLEELGL